MGGLAAPLMVTGSLLSAYGQASQGALAEQVGRYTAASKRQEANQAIGESQLSAEEAQRQSDYVASRALAVAAASGGGASDPTVVNILSRIAGEGAYRKSVALYEGQSKAQALRSEANIAEAGGTAEKRGRYIGAASTLMSGGSSLYSRFGRNPNSTTNTVTASDNWFKW